MVLHIQPEDKKIDIFVRRFIEGYLAGTNNQRRVVFEDFAGGTDGAVEKFKENLLPLLKKDDKICLMLAVDYDHCSEKSQEEILAGIENKFHERVFILTFKKESEDFLRAFKPSGNPNAFNKNKVGYLLAELFLNEEALNREQKRDCKRWEKAEQKHLVFPENTLSRLKEKLRFLREG